MRERADKLDWALEEYGRSPPVNQPGPGACAGRWKDGTGFAETVLELVGHADSGLVIEEWRSLSGGGGGGGGVRQRKSHHTLSPHTVINIDSRYQLL